MSSAFLKNLFGLDRQSAIVVGGTGVLGGAVASGLASAGAKVFVAGRSRERGQARVDGILAEGGAAKFLEIDSLSRDSLTAARDHVSASHGSLDMLVNCAGVNSNTPYEQIEDDEWDRVVASNLKATHLACQIMAPAMASQENGGSILNIGSVTAHLPLSKVFAYSAAKAGVVNLTKNLAREYAPQGVRVNVMCPGFFPAEQNRKLLTEERQGNIVNQTAMQRFGEPHELVGMAILLLSRNAGSYITGADMYVDGGFTAMRF